jgi:hypothetical protein
VKTENIVTRCLLFSATDVNDTFDDDEADPEYNVLADEEKETGENYSLSGGSCPVIVSCRNWDWRSLALEAVYISAHVLEGLAEGKGEPCAM